MPQNEGSEMFWTAKQLIYWLVIWHNQNLRNHCKQNTTGFKQLHFIYPMKVWDFWSVRFAGPHIKRHWLLTFFHKYNLSQLQKVLSTLTLYSCMMSFRQLGKQTSKHYFFSKTGIAPTRLITEKDLDFTVAQLVHGNWEGIKFKQRSSL